MRKRIRFKSLLLDLFMVSACLSVAGYFSYTFWKDLNSSASRSDKEKIAVITFKNRIAQRKFEDRVVWERIDKSTPLYNGDLVRTSDLAEAVITFNDNSQIDIFENTMIQVYYSDTEGIKINLDNGNLQLDTSTTGKVAMKFDDGSVVNVQSGSSLAAKSSAKAVEMKSGAATVTTESGNQAELKGGETVAVHQGGEIKKQPVTVTSIPPEMKVLNVDGGNIPVKLEWNLAEKEVLEDVPVIVQTSTDKNFSKILKEVTVAPGQSSVGESILNVNQGLVYWRVFPKNRVQEASMGKISVESSSPVKLISPVENGAFTYKSRTPDINFRWSGADYAEKFLIAVSASPDMTDPVFTAVTENHNLKVNSIGSGKWWWQITPYYSMNSIGYSGESVVSSFSIVRNDQIRPPLLAVPNEHSVVTYKEAPAVNLSWKSDIKDANYQVLVATDPDFNDVIYTKNTKSTQLAAKLPKESEELYWKVIRNSNETSDLTPESEVRSFKMEKYQPEKARLLYPPEIYSVELSKLTATQFAWKLADEDKGKKSIIQVSSKRNFSSMQLEQTIDKTTFENMMLPVGNWWWRAGSVDENGEVISFTEPRKISVLRELEAPAFNKLKENQEVQVAKNGPVIIYWADVPGADYYNVRVFDLKNNLVAENPEAYGNSCQFSLPDQAYTCRIQAVCKEKDGSPMRTGPVTSIDFSVRTPTPIRLAGPVNSSRLDGLNALRKPVSFTWKDGSDKPASYQFVLKKRMPDGSLRVVEKTNTTKLAYSMNRLTTGDYTWQILANTKEGVAVNSEVNAFTITPVKTLPKAELTNPSANFVMDSKFLRKNRSITFEWNQVPGATEYSFVLYRKEPGGRYTPVYAEKGVKGTKLKFKKMDLLDVGGFTWNVTAYCYAKDGYEEQRSPVAAGDFNISFKAPQKIETVNPGRMYGE